MNESKQCEEQIHKNILLSVVTPSYNEADNLPLLYERLCHVLQSLQLDWEWIVVDDHSSNRTLSIIQALAKKDTRVRGLRFSRNFGSNIANTCGLQHASGACAIVMAADLQDSPETLPLLFKEWQDGAQVVWAVRARREYRETSKVAFARLYYFLMRHVIGIRWMPSSGSDFFLVDRRVLDAFCQFKESNESVLALITWMGFRQETITYTKQARAHGRSGWSLRKKIKLVVDSITSFSYMPIRLMSILGFIISTVGFLYAGIIIINYLAGNRVEGLVIIDGRTAGNRWFPDVDNGCSG